MNEKNSQMDVYTLRIDSLAGRAFRACLVILLVLIFFDYVFNYRDVFNELSIRRIWNIAREQSVPTWFSSILAHLLAVTVFLIAWAEAPLNSRLKTIAWVLVGLFFLWIGIDDFAEIHEKLGGALVRMAEQGENSAVTSLLLQNPSFSWHTFIAPIFIICGVLILAFLWAAFWKFGLLHYITLGFGCWAVAQGLDFIEGLDNVDQIYGWFQETLGIARKYGVTHTFKVIEEALEMLGTMLLWLGFMKYFARVSNGLQIRLDKG